jgi:hypothetical protein
MKAMSMSMFVFVAVAACGSQGESNPGPVWGDAVEPLVQSWCEMRARCFGPDDQDQCVRHNRHHLCELEDTCEVPTSGTEGPMAVCIAAIDAIDSPTHPGCIESQYGVVPSECQALLDLMPDP